METPDPFTTRHRSVVGQEMAVGSPVLLAGEAVQGAGDSDQPVPSQSSTRVPTTATQVVVVGQDTPGCPAWLRARVAVPSVVPNAWGVSHVPSR